MSVWEPQVEKFLDRIGWTPADSDMLYQALSHRSWCGENAPAESNERMEFLGDAVLGLVVAEELYRTRPYAPEGELAKARSAVVSSAALSDVARCLGLGEIIRLGKGEDSSGGRSKTSILADCLEAVIGAVYLDAGFETVRSMILGILGDRIEATSNGEGDDFKTRLQELAAREFECLPEYRVEASGPDHARRFSASVTVGAVKGSGHGQSKKSAEQSAAKAALELLISPPLDESSDADTAVGVEAPIA